MLHDQGWGATETHRCAFEVGTRTCASRVAVVSLRWPGSAGVPACLLLSLPAVLPPRPLRTLLMVLLLFFVFASDPDSEGAWASQAGEAFLSQ